MTDNDAGIDPFAVSAGLIVAFAAVLRFRDLDWSLYEDEAWVAELALRGAWKPHAWLTPPAFFAALKAWTALRGSAAEVLRQPAALFGVILVAVPLFATTLSRLTRGLWMFLLAFSSPLLFYSARIKQYTLEATVAAVLVVCLLRALESSRRAWIAFAVVALAGVCTLYAPIFVVFAAAIASLAAERGSWKRTVALFLVLGAAFIAAYVGYLAPGPESTRLHGDMDEFFRVRERWVTSPSALVASTMNWTGQALNLTRGWWLLLLIAGLLWLNGRDPRKTKLAVICLAAVPPAVIALVSAMELYPYGEVRLMIFSFPALFLLAALALSSLAERFPRTGGLLVAVFCGAFLWQGVVRQTYNATFMRLSDLRPLYDYVVLHHRAGEPIFVDDSNRLPLAFHDPRLKADLRVGSPESPGWFVGRESATAGIPLTILYRTADTIAARVKPAEPGAAGGE